MGLKEEILWVHVDEKARVLSRAAAWVCVCVFVFSLLLIIHVWASAPYIQKLKSENSIVPAFFLYAQEAFYVQQMKKYLSTLHYQNSVRRYVMYHKRLSTC